MKVCVRILIACVFIVTLVSVPLQTVSAKGNVFTVYPTGTDDTLNLQQAFEKAKAAGPGSTVRLVKGKYRTGMIDVSNFYGNFQGAGIGQTVLLPLHHMDCQANANENKNNSLFIFRLGDPHVSNMTFFIDDPEPCAVWTWELSGGWNRYSLESALLFTGSVIGSVDPCSHLTDEQGGGSVDRVEFKTPVDRGEDSSYYVVRALYFNPELVTSEESCYFWTSFLHGNYSVTNSIFNSQFVDLTSFLTGGRIYIANNTFINSWLAIDGEDVQGTEVVIQNNTFKYPKVASINAYSNQWEAWDTQPNFTIPVTYAIHGNTFYQDKDTIAIDMIDFSNLNYGEHRTRGSIYGNHIVLNGPGTLGINVEAVNDVLVNFNRVEGNGKGGILFNAWTYFEIPSALLMNGRMVANDLRSFAPFDPGSFISPIYLGKETNHCTVIGANLSDTVIDEGTNNILIGVNITKDRPRFEALKDRRPRDNRSRENR